MSERGGLPRTGGVPSPHMQPSKPVSITSNRPVHMNLYATWEVDRSSPSCVPRYARGAAAKKHAWSVVVGSGWELIPVAVFTLGSFFHRQTFTVNHLKVTWSFLLYNGHLVRLGANFIWSQWDIYHIYNLHAIDYLLSFMCISSLSLVCCSPEENLFAESSTPMFISNYLAAETKRGKSKKP